MAHWRQSKHCGADVFLHVLRVWVSRRVSQSPTPKCGKKRSKSGGNFSNPEGCGLTLVPLLAVLIRGCCHLPGPIHALLEELWVPWPPTGTSQNVWAWLKGTHTSLTVSAICSLCVSTCLNGGQSCCWWFCFVYFFSPFCLSLVVAFCLLCFCLLFLNSLSLCVAFFFFPVPSSPLQHCLQVHAHTPFSKSFPSVFHLFPLAKRRRRRDQEKRQEQGTLLSRVSMGGPRWWDTKGHLL